MLAMLCACEVIADFDREKLDERRTIGPTPLPTLDGAVALIPDAAQPDGALIGRDDAGSDAGGAALDAAVAVDAAGFDNAVTFEVDAAALDATTVAISSN